MTKPATGSFRYVSRRPHGKDVGQRGVFIVVVRPERIVHREVWEDWDAGETVATVVLVERDGKTTLTSTALFPSREVRDTVLKSGMERGAAVLYDRLAQLLASTIAPSGA